MSADWWSDDVRPLSQLIDELAGFIEPVGSREAGAVMTVDRLSVELPLEVRVATADGTAAAVTVATPERTATSFAPSVHRLAMRISRQDAG